MKARADFHIHSCLSPCGSLEMSPSAIVKSALAEGLDLIAITDHNSAGNCPALRKLCAKEKGLACFFGIEATASEEVHCLCLFDGLEAVLRLDAMLYKSLPDVPPLPGLFSGQVIVDEDETVLGEVDRSLANATEMPMMVLRDWVRAAGGLFIPSHVERAYSSLTSQLGFVPKEDFDAVEVSRFAVRDEKALEALDIGRYAIVTNSDAHQLEDVGAAWNEFEFDGEIKEFKISDLKKILVEKRTTPGVR